MVKHLSMKKSLISICALALVSCTEWSEENPPGVLPLPQKAVYADKYFVCDSQSEDASADYFKFADVSIDERYAGELGDEGYSLKVNSNGISIKAATETGVFYARQTLSQLTDSMGVRFAKITDYPRFSYRGIHLDVSRNFFTKEQIKKILDEMARYKLNNFHFHLTDNGGWRIQIDKYPLLTKLGSHRTVQSWFDWYVKNRKFCPEDTPGAIGGYYTKDDIREIVKYAEDRHINVIPEIDIPAHSDPVFAGYPELNCTCSTSGNGEYCPANEQVYTFIEDVLDEILELFPSKVIHIGGDEARKVEWKKCPSCKALMEKEGISDYDQLQVYFIRRIEEYLKSKGRTMAGWDELLKDEKLDSSTVIYCYRGQKYGIEAANKNLKTIMVPGEVLYMDWWQADINQEPYAMGGYSPLYKTFLFNPVPATKKDVMANEILISSRKADTDSVGVILSENEKNVIGIQGCLWTEFVEDAKHLEYMMFPRFLSIAEKGWSKTSGWEDFKKRISIQYGSLAKRGIQAYDMHDAPYITAKSISENKSEVTMTCEQYGGEIRYTTEQGKVPGPDSQIYKGPFTIHEDTDINAAVYIGGKLKSYIRHTHLYAGQDKDIEYPVRWPW